MKIQEAITLICKKKGVFLVKKFVRNHNKLNKNNDDGKASKYYCKNHKKYHKYTFHAYIETVPGLAFFLGLDTAKEVINYAKNI